MFRKIFLLSIASLAFLSSVFGQKLFRDGYVINANGDTLKGLVQYFEGNRVPQKITFKRFDIAQPISYGVENLNAYGFENGSYYVKKDLNGKSTFLACLVNGKISVYSKSPRRIFVEKDNVLFELHEREFVVNIDGRTYALKNYLELLKLLTNDLDSFAASDNLKKSETEITNFIVRYNQLFESEFIVYNLNADDFVESYYADMVRKKKGEFGILLGLVHNITSFNAYYEYSDDNTTRSSYQNSSFGFFYNYRFSGIDDGFSVQFEINYLRSGQTTTMVAPAKYDRGNHIINYNSEYQTLVFPISLRHSFKLSNASSFVGLGIAYNWLLFNKYDGVLVVEQTQSSFPIVDSQYKYYAGNFTPFLAVGYMSKVWNKYTIGSEIRAQVKWYKKDEDSVHVFFGNTEKLKFAIFDSPRASLTHQNPVISLLLYFGF
jgi:hypothetical protein